MNRDLRVLSDQERLDWLRLIRSDNIGPRTFGGLMQKFGSAGAALRALPDLIRKSRSAREITICSLESAERELARAAELGVTFIALCEPAHPAALRAIDSAPPLIGVAGSLAVLARPAVAIIGSRNASASGLVFTDRLARGLGTGGYVIVSGLARGIDGKAHQSSLDTGTIAVLAGGHDRIYPSEHEALARRILDRGAVISEMPIGWEPRARDFPRRNRIVSGLALGTVVVEASRRSGSLITARFANEQGREVFAVPGSPLDARAEGTNDLLRQGATLCTSVDDILNALAPVRSGEQGSLPLREPQAPERDIEPMWDEIDLFAEFESFAPTVMPLADANDFTVDEAPVGEAESIVELIGVAPVSIDDLVRMSGQPARLVLAALTELELEGRIRRNDGNRVSLDLTIKQD